MQRCVNFTYEHVPAHVVFPGGCVGGIFLKGAWKTQPEQKGAHKNIKNGKSKCCLHIFGQMFAVGNDPLAGLLSCGCSTSQMGEKGTLEPLLFVNFKIKMVFRFSGSTFFKLNAAHKKRTN